MKAVFVELPAFERHRSEYLNDAGFRQLAAVLMANPEAGDIVPGAGGLSKLRFADPRRRTGRRSGLRVIYYWWKAGSQFWLFTVYDKDEVADLTARERRMLKAMIKSELDARSKP